MAQYTDSQLFSRIAAGDEEAFATLFHRYTPQLSPFLVSIVKSEADAREILQETFLKCWLNRDKLDGVDNPGAWLNTVACVEQPSGKWFCSRALARFRVETLLAFDSVALSGTCDWHFL